MRDDGAFLWLSAAVGFCAGLLGGALAKASNLDDLGFIEITGDDRVVDIPALIDEVGDVVDKAKSLTA